jgi:hypothetical protein
MRKIVLTAATIVALMVTMNSCYESKQKALYNAKEQAWEDYRNYNGDDFVLKHYYFEEYVKRNDAYDNYIISEGLQK